MVLGPGPTVNTLGTVATARRSSRSPVGRPPTSAGQLRLTTVGVQPDGDAARARSSAGSPTTRRWCRASWSTRRGESHEQVEQRNAEDFQASQTSAETAALRELGFPVQVVVETVAADGPAAGALKVGDVITSVDGSR